MLKGGSDGLKETENPDHSILAKEIALHHRHEEMYVLLNYQIYFYYH